MDPNDPLKYATAWNNLSSSVGARVYGTSDGGIMVFNQPSWGTTVREIPVWHMTVLGGIYF
ncbi:MAG: hypothetical protein R2942_02695 [Ignavibacteria bacterium]